MSWSKITVLASLIGSAFRLRRIQADFPQLIWCSITGFGADGPYADRPAYDAVAGALSGIGSITLDPREPKTSGPTIADNVTGMYAVYGILGALYERERSGRGRRIEVNMLESAVAFIPDAFSNFTRLNSEDGPRNRVATSQSFAFRCADGKLLALHLSSPPKFWEALLRVLDQPDLNGDLRFATRDERVRNFSALEATLAVLFEKKERAYWLERLLREDIPYAPIQTVSEVLDNEQVRHLGTFYDEVHPTEGPLTLIRRPVLIDGDRDIATRPPPTLGEHTAEVLGSAAPKSRK